MGVFYILTEDQDPLTLIKRNKKFVALLKENGIDGLEINKILHKRYGVKIKIPISETKQEKDEREQADYAQRYIKAIITKASNIITDKERKNLNEMHERLSQYQFDSSVEIKRGVPIINMRLKKDEGSAKSFKQVSGLMVVELHDYIVKFCEGLGKKYNQQKIFDLIGELMKYVENKELTRERVKKLYDNNVKYFRQ